MLTYKIFLNTDMTIKDVISSGNLVQYSWNNISVNVYIPKAIYETSPSISNTVSMTFTQTKENGDTVITNDARLYEFSYVKDNVMVNNIEYVLLTRQMPQQMTLYFGNTQKFQINHLVISDNELISFAQSPLYQYEVFQASNTQEIHDEPSTADELQADINRAKEDIESLKTYKQDKSSTNIHVRTTSAVDDDPQQFTTSVESGLNVLSVRNDDLEIDNKKNKEDIADIKATMTSQFTPLGKLDGNTSEPTLAQINAWLSAQGITQLELGDLITYVGHVTGAVDTNYNCLYTKNGWIWYETTSLETASNTEMGIVKGNGNNTNSNEVIDIQNGEIQGIKVKDMNGTQRYLKGYINDLEDKQAKILDGTTSVPKATNSQNDGLGNNIQATYQTKTIGASKQYVKDYALAKMFNELNYINYDAIHTDIEHGFVGGNIQKTVSTIGDVKLFDAYYKTTAYEYELSQNNVFSISLPIMLNVSKTAKIKVVVKCDNNATDNNDTPFVIGTAESDNISFVANQVSKVDIQGSFTSLTQPITITPEKQLVVEVYIFNTDMQSFEINIYNTLSQPSTFTLTIPYQTIQIVEGGAIGQQYLHRVCNYNATATSTLGVGWVFDIDTELVNNTEHKFIARITDLSRPLEDKKYIRVASGGVEIPVIATFEEGEEQQPYFDEYFNKFLYFVDTNTSIIMFSAFYTNGQFIIVEPNDVDYAKTFDIDAIMNGVYPVGKAKADENGNNIATTYATKTELLNGNPKPLYHLGAYDSYVDNGDGTTTITRQTGYVDLGSLNWIYSPTNNFYTSDDALASYILKPSTNGSGAVITWACNTATPTYADNVYLGNNGVAVGVNGTVYFKNENTNSTTKPSGLLQYKLATSYQEKVITNQPLNTLDQNGSQWVRDEWEKGLNKFNNPYTYTNANANGVSITINKNSCMLNGTSTAGYYHELGSISLKAGTYSFKEYILSGSFSGTNISLDNIKFGLYDTNISGLALENREGTFTLTQDTTIDIVIWFGESGITFNSCSIGYMVVDGDHAYHYVPYNENKHITNGEATLLKEEYEKSLNLLNLPDVAETTKNGITYKVKDGVLTLNGTATATVNLVLCNVLVLTGTYYFKSFGATGTNSTYFTQIEQVTPLGTVLANSYDNKSVTITGRNMYIYYRLVVRQGETLSNVQFKDMITKGSTPTPIFYPYNGNIVHEKDLVKFRNELPLIKTFNGTYEQWLAQNISDSRVIKMKVILLLQEDDTPSYVDANCGYSNDAQDTQYLYYNYYSSQYRQVSATDNVIVYYI